MNNGGVAKPDQFYRGARARWALLKLNLRNSSSGSQLMKPRKIVYYVKHPSVGCSSSPLTFAVICK